MIAMRTIPSIVALLACFASSSLADAQEASPAPPPQPSPPPFRIFTVEPRINEIGGVGWAPEQTPADFLDAIASHIKARWRQHYREAPPVPPNERERGAFVLGSLLADSFLALQATDAQQFRNTNQDVLAYCRTLGLGEKLTPRLMSQGKLAETEDWAGLRQEVVDGHQELCRLLKEQRDEDLATLVDIGVWVRLLHVVAGMVAESDEAALFPMCIGSESLLKELQSRYTHLSAAARKHDRIAALGTLIDTVANYWINLPLPEKERVVRTRDKLQEIMTRVTLK
jgi:hypothetical protein